MNSLVKVFSNFKEFYSEINGATLTGAIDVVVVEQPDGTFICSPFHVRFGKLGVLRSREKIVDIEVNGEPVDIHMKLGESGEAFFVEEYHSDDEEETLPDNLATSPILGNEFATFDQEQKNINNNLRNHIEDDELSVLRPRRNSIDLSTECDESEKKFENQVSDFKHRRYTDNVIKRRDLNSAKNEFTTQKLRQEWAEHEQETMLRSITDNDLDESAGPEQCDRTCDSSSTEQMSAKTIGKQASFVIGECDGAEARDESKQKKKRRKRSVMRKKSTVISTSATFPLLHGVQRKDSSSSTNSAIDCSESYNDADETDPDLSFATLSNHTAVSTPNLSPNGDQLVPNEEIGRISCSKPMSDFLFFSDTEAGDCRERPSTPIRSDSEIEITRTKSNDDVMTNSASWKWGELPTPLPMNEQHQGPISDDAKQAQRLSMISNVFNFMKQSKGLRNSATPANAEGVYLSDLDVEGLDPEVEALYFPPISPVNQVDNDDHESGNGTSLPHSPSSIESPKSCDSDYEEGKSHEKNRVVLSMCGGLEFGGPTDKEFDEHIIDYSEVCQNPTIFSSPSLVVRINDINNGIHYYDWASACAIVITSLAFRKPLSLDAVEQLKNQKATKLKSSIDPLSLNGNTNEIPNSRYSWWYWRRSGGKRQQSDVAPGSDLSHDNTSYASRDVNVGPNAPDSPTRIVNTTLSSDKSVDSEIFNEKYKKSLRLTSDQIDSLNLKEGMNEVMFSVTTAYQGTSRCKCYLFRWKHNDKVVISDIDGTITKSDVLGHILPMVGRDWAQLGVAQLFSKIEANGYKLLYLSARAIGQSRVTREYLRSIRQGDVKLPDGPLLLNPTSLISAFHREVIERKPEQFKIACLSDIQALFPQNPFYAGYGNRINDVWAYRAVGIPIMRIFTINPKGELKHELTQTFQSSYCSMTFIVDQLFPPNNDLEESNNEFTNVNYWRDPILDVTPVLLNELNSSESEEAKKQLMSTSESTITTSH